MYFNSDTTNQRGRTLLLLSLFAMELLALAHANVLMQQLLNFPHLLQQFITTKKKKVYNTDDFFVLFCFLLDVILKWNKNIMWITRSVVPFGIRWSSCVRCLTM